MTGSSASASASAADSMSSDGIEVAFMLSAVTPSPDTPSPTPDTPTPTPAPSPPSSADDSSTSTYLRSPSAAVSPEKRDESGDRSRDNSRPRGSDCRSGSKSASGSEETLEQLQHRRRTTGTCSSYPSKFKECAEPRNCFDCLNFVVTTEVGGCMLNEYGRCVAVRDYWNASMDFSRFEPANANDSTVRANATKVASTGSRSGSGSSSANATVQLPPPRDPRYQFRADKAEYCNKDDALCTACRRTVFADFIEGATDRGRSAYCIGEGGCICIAVCEARRDHPPPPPNKDCFAKSFAANKKEVKSSAGAGPWASVSAILGAMLFVVITVFAIYRVRSKSERRSRNDSVGGGNGGSNNNSSGIGGGNGNAADSVNVVATPEAGSSPSNTTMVTVTSTTAGSRLLNLFGWQAMRDDLINKEHLRFAGVEAVSPVKHSNVQFLGVEPSAPEIDSAVPTAPMAAMAIPVHVPMAMMASAPMVFSVRATASAPDFEDMDDEVFL